MIMTKSEKFYLIAILIHIGIGFLFFFLPILGYVYGLAVVAFGLVFVIKTQNKNHEVLLIAAYFTGIDVYLKMIGSSISNEFGKYMVIVFMLLGIIYRGFSKSAFLYVFFISLLLPAIFIGTQTLSFDVNIRKAIAFNMSGPVCLGIAAIYTFQRSISFTRLMDVLKMLFLPMVAMLVNLFLYTPSIKEVVINTQSNFATSGGFGPNQVSTVLGLAMFVAFVQLLFGSKSKLLQLVNATLVVLFAFRCIVTFSRGGMLTGLILMLLLLLFVYGLGNAKVKAKIFVLAGAAVFTGLVIWGYTSIQTAGLIDKRYANENARGVKKSSAFSGREVLFAEEVKMFVDHPYFGVGVGRNKEVRAEETGIAAASHNEMSRLLAEHGSLGLVAFLILLFTPVVLYVQDNKQFFAIVFMVFWLLTINHAAMRIAAPAFMYSLALLKVRFEESVA